MRVYLPTCRRPQLLPRALTSLRAQTCPDWVCELHNDAPDDPGPARLVADDAGCELPGTVFWKGHESVSRAARELPALGFTNVLNVGHNRVYQRTG